MLYGQRLTCNNYTGRGRDAAVPAVHVHGDAARVHEPALVPLPHVQDGGRRGRVHRVRARVPPRPRRVLRQVRQLLLRLWRQARLQVSARAETIFRVYISSTRFLQLTLTET